MCYLLFIFTVIGTNLLIECNKIKIKKDSFINCLPNNFPQMFFLTIATKTVTEQAKLRKIN